MIVKAKNLPLLLLILLLNVTLASAQDYPLSLAGIINNETPFIEIPIVVETNVGQITIDIRPTSGDLDTLLYLIDDKGVIVAENDDRARDDYSSLIEFPQAPTGNYSIIATRYGVEEGESAGEYELSVDISPPSSTASSGYSLDLDTLKATGYPILEPHEPATWTIFAYYGADTNLESALLNDLNEFELAGGSTDAVRIIAFLDRSPRYTDSSGDWNDIRIFEVSADTSQDHLNIYPPTIDSKELFVLDERNTGAGETLAQFLTWGINTYPAEHYAIALAGHGAGWEGIVVDETDDNALLSIPELREVFASVQQATATHRFDLLINDACNMASIEYYDGISSFFDYSLGSPELIVNPAFDMTLLTELLNTPTLADIPDVGQSLVDKYIERDIHIEGGDDAVYYTGALTNLNNFDQMTAVTEAFASIVNSNPANYTSLLGQARANTYTYTAFAGDATRIDLGDFMRQIITYSNDLDLVNAAQTIIETLDLVHIYGNAGETAVRKSSYYNIYFPLRSDEFNPAYFDQVALPEWGQMLRSYYNIVTPQQWVSSNAVGFHEPKAPQVRVTNAFPEVISFNQAGTIKMEVVGKNITQIVGTLDQILPDGRRIRLGAQAIPTIVFNEETGATDYLSLWESGINISELQFFATALQASDGTNQGFDYFQITADGGAPVASLDGRLRAIGDDEWQDVTVIFTQDRTAAYSTLLSMRSTTVLSRNTESASLGVIDVEPGSLFQGYQGIVTADGRVQLQPSTTYTWSEEGLLASQIPIPSGKYEIGLLVETFGGTSGFATTSITVDNDRVDTDIMADTSYADELGFSLQFPSSWDTALSYDGDSYYYVDDFYLNLNNLHNEISVQVFDGVTDMEAIKQGVEDNLVYGGNILVPQKPAELVIIEGREALEYQYMIENPENPNANAWVQGFIIIDQDLELGLAFSTWSIMLRTDEASRASLYTILRDGVRFYDALDLQSNDTTQWHYVNFGAEVSHPVLMAWSSEIDAKGWTRYTPDGNLDNPIYASFNRLSSSQENVTELLDQLILDKDNIRLQTYYGEHHTWQSASYTIADHTVGRVYMTIINDQTYAMHFETPTELATDYFANIFEPMLDGIVIQETHTTFTSEELGISFQYPNDVLGWGSLEYIASEQALLTRGIDGNSALEVYYVSDTEPDLMSIAERVSVLWDTISYDEVSTQISGRNSLEFSVQTESGDSRWIGRYSTVYDEERQLGLIFGTWVLEGEGDLDTVYQSLKDSVEFTSGAFSDTKTYIDDDAGFAIELPILWNRPIVRHLDNTTRVILTRNEDEVIQYFVIDDASPDLEIMARNIEKDSSGVMGDVILYDFVRTELIGQDALEFKITLEGLSGTWEGQYIAIYDARTDQGIVLGARAVQDAGEYQSLYQLLRDSFERITP